MSWISWNDGEFKTKAIEWGKKVVTIKKTVKIQVSLRLIAKFIVDVTAKEKKVYYKYVNIQTSSHKVNIHDVNDIMDNILIELDDIILREGNTNKPTEKNR